jgi:hypothetical protein
VRTSLILLLAVAACGRPLDNSIEPGPYRVEDVRVMIDVVAEVAKDEYPNARSEIDEHGYRIRIVDQLEGGCLDLGWERSGCENDGEIVVAAGPECLAQTALGHELIHLVFEIHDRRSTDHPFPAFAEHVSMAEATKTWEIRAILLGEERMCGLRRS